MGEAYKGGCACGDVRYEIRGEPLFQNHCHCRQCQRLTGAGHGSFLSFLKADASLSGSPATWKMTPDSGNEKARGFCTRCGSPVFLTFGSEIFTVPAGSLDEPERFQAQAVTYASRALTWDHLEPGLTTFDGMPPS